MRSNRPAWPPGAESPTSSVAAADAAEARGRRRMEKRHFQTRSSSLGKLLAHDVDDGGDDEVRRVLCLSVEIVSKGFVWLEVLR